jgi:uncharacterized membrane protein YecN with MAPEG domain
MTSCSCNTLFFSPFYFIQYLSSNVVGLRVSSGIYLGDGGEGSVRDPKKAANVDGASGAQLQRAIRAHANFSEQTPFAFFLIFLAELNGAPTALVHGAFTTLFLARVAHGSFGIQTDDTVGLGRPIGYFTTLGVTALAGLYNVSVSVFPLLCHDLVFAYIICQHTAQPGL